MEKYIDVMKQSVDLSITMLDGLHHIQHLLSEGQFEKTMYLFEDVISAFASVEQSIAPVMERLKSNDTVSTSRNVQESLELVVNTFEEKNYGKIQEIMQFSMIPRTKKWHEEIVIAFEPFLLS